MFGLPAATALNKPLPKKAVFETFAPKPSARRLFDAQISRMAIAAEISPQTVNIAAGEEVSLVFVIHLLLKVPDCDAKNLLLLSRLIKQHMLFALHHENTVRLAVFRAGKMLFSEEKAQDEWAIPLGGTNMDTLWDNICAAVAGIELSGDRKLDAAIIANEERAELLRQIALLEKKAMKERQPRKKWDYAEEIQRLKAVLEKIL